MPTFNHIQIEGNSKPLFFIPVRFSVDYLYFMDKVLLLIVAVRINSHYLLVSLIIASRAGVCWFCFCSMSILCSCLRYKSPTIYHLER